MRVRAMRDILGCLSDSEFNDVVGIIEQALDLQGSGFEQVYYELMRICEEKEDAVTAECVANVLKKYTPESRGLSILAFGAEGEVGVADGDRVQLLFSAVGGNKEAKQALEDAMCVNQDLAKRLQVREESGEPGDYYYILYTYSTHQKTRNNRNASRSVQFLGYYFTGRPERGRQC